MLELNDEGIVIEEDWGWPVNIIQISENGDSIFWIVWCAKGNDCTCTPSAITGISDDRHKALEAWRFKHFVESRKVVRR